ncbi:flavodoxin domain-containing protein [Indiicoccus explosivorum]|uniref:flavodoxin domain-containing protein n=1 Tax=Indiicoccus explosivorum TaxID=1917864 RepID=UPI000B4402E1|nr:flavodoxin domain-containing protein [Indiicoccus explosivorum]
MVTVCLIYTTMTGNTEEIADILAGELTERGATVVKKNMSMDPISAGELAHADGIAFGTYTYSDGELPFETEETAEDLERMDLAGKPVALFGSGDTMYEHFCGAVDEMTVRFQRMGVHLVEPVLKVELDPDPADIDPCIRLAENLLAAIRMPIT